MPVNFMGRALGVLHVTGAKGKPPNPEQIAQLTALGVHAGNRIGTLRAFERSQLQASTDSLTGLTNRRAAEEVLANLMAVDSAFAVVMADLDFFKRLNDTMGHEAGDRALKLLPTPRAAWCATVTTWCAGVGRSSRCCCPASTPSAPRKWSRGCAPRWRRLTCWPERRSSRPASVSRTPPWRAIARA
jgi:hypothetical protein